MPLKPKLRYLLTAAFILVSLVPVFFLGAWVQKTALENEVAAVAEKHLLIARNLTAALERYAADSIAAFKLFISLEPSPQPNKDVGELAAQLGFRHFCVVDSEGRVLKQVDPAGAAGAAITPDVLAELRALAGETRSFSPVMADSQGRGTIYLLERLDEGHIAIGVLSTDYLVKLQKAIAFGHRGHAAIVDHQGNVIAHPSAEWQRDRKNIVKIDAVRRMVAGESGVSRFYSPVMQGDMIAGFASVPGPGWGVMVPQPLEELEASAAEVQRVAQAIALVGLGVAALLGWWLAGRVARPVADVVQAANAMSEGRLEARVPPQSKFVPDEIRELAGAFNDMAAHLEDNRRDLIDAMKNAQMASRAKSEFLTNMSHELRTPLNAIIGFSELVKGEVFGPLGDPKYRGYAEDIYQSGSHLLDLINEILDLARIEADQMRLRESAVDPSAVIRACERLVRQRAEQAALELTVDLPASGLRLWADERALKQVLLNLLSNAIKFTPSGGRLRVSAEVAVDGCFRLSVADTGIGIAEKDIPLVFLPFGQADGSLARKYEGTGLGLPLARSLAELHGGRLDLVSTPGSGTTVTLQLPAERCLAEPVQSSEEAWARLSAALPTPA